jgi:hypothetical protein
MRFLGADDEALGRKSPGKGDDKYGRAWDLGAGKACDLAVVSSIW